MVYLSWTVWNSHILKNPNHFLNPSSLIFSLPFCRPVMPFSDKFSKFLAVVSSRKPDGRFLNQQIGWIDQNRGKRKIVIAVGGKGGILLLLSSSFSSFSFLFSFVRRMSGISECPIQNPSSISQARHSPIRSSVFFAQSYSLLSFPIFGCAYFPDFRTE